MSVFSSRSNQLESSWKQLNLKLRIKAFLFTVREGITPAVTSENVIIQLKLWFGCDVPLPSCSNFGHLKDCLLKIKFKFAFYLTSFAFCQIDKYRL